MRPLTTTADGVSVVRNVWAVMALVLAPATAGVLSSIRQLNDQARTCYGETMLKAYVGVASRHGLTVFHPERDETLSLVRTCVHESIRRTGFWAVLDHMEARSVHALFLNGHRREALMLLDRCAKDICRILPSDSSRLH